MTGFLTVAVPTFLSTIASNSVNVHVVFFLQNNTQLKVSKGVCSSVMQNYCCFYLSDSNSMVDLLVEYFKRFGDKSCCFSDLSPYLHLNLEEQSERRKVKRKLLTWDLRFSKGWSLSEDYSFCLGQNHEINNNNGRDVWNKALRNIWCTARFSLRAFTLKGEFYIWTSFTQGFIPHSLNFKFAWL